MKVLIVDDSKAIYLMVKEMLEEAGHVAAWAEDGLCAVQAVKEDTSFDLILLDWNMPNMNGLEFLELNAKDKITQTPIVMMTTENKPDYIRKSLSLGAVEYIMKPFTSDILINKISLALD